MQQQQQQPGMQQRPQLGMDGGALGAAAIGAMGAMGMGGFNGAMGNVLINEATSQIQNSFIARLLPGFMASIHGLFAVGHSFVFRKMLLLMCPFIKLSQGAPSVASSFMQDTGSPMGAQGGSSQFGADGLKVDVEDPDLSLPLMSYVTYILLYAMQRGMISDFHPEVLSSTASFALVLLILEAGAAKMAFYVAGTTVPMMDLLANCGYKFVP